VKDKCLRKRAISGGSATVACAWNHLFTLSPHGTPSFPFYRSRERFGVHEGEREREKRERGIEEREKQRGREPWGRIALLLLQAGPAGLVDDNGNGSMS
jgi:hypothetical protein